MDHGNVFEINRYRSKSNAGIQSIYFGVENNDCHKHMNCPTML